MAGWIGGVVGWIGGVVGWIGGVVGWIGGVVGWIGGVVGWIKDAPHTWWLCEVDLHYCYKRCIQIVCLWILSIECLNRVGPARNSEYGLYTPATSTICNTFY